MKISPKLQWITYGTAVAIGVSVTGTLWYDRGGSPKVVDYIEVYQRYLENCLATRYASDIYSDQYTKGYTNYIATWAVDPAHTYEAYDSAGNGIETNYWTFAGYERSDVYRNPNAGSFRVSPFSPGSGYEMHGDSGDKYIWNWFSNITVTADDYPEIDGTYKLAINGSYEEAQSWLDSQYILDTPLTDLSGWNRREQVMIYTNASDADDILIDFGPISGRTSADAWSCGIWTYSLIDWYPSLRTRKGDSIFNGWWYAGNGETLCTNGVSVVGSDETPALLREALISWWVNRSGDSQYSRTGFNGIPAVPGKVLFDALDYALTDNWSGSLTTYGRYIKEDSVLAGFTNIQSFQDLSDAFRRESIAGWADVPTGHTNGHVVSTNDLNYYKALLQQFAWTRYDRWHNSQSPWKPEGYNSVQQSKYTNGIVGYAESLVSSADAIQKAVAAAVPVADVDWGTAYPHAYAIIGHGNNWVAAFYIFNCELTYMGASTSITHTADFYAAADVVPYVYFTYDNCLSGAPSTTNLYEKIGSQGPDKSAHPFILVHTDYADMTWPDDPPYGYYAARGFVCRDEAEIIMKWAWEYMQ